MVVNCWFKLASWRCTAPGSLAAATTTNRRARPDRVLPTSPPPPRPTGTAYQRYSPNRQQQLPLSREGEEHDAQRPGSTRTARWME